MLLQTINIHSLKIFAKYLLFGAFFALVLNIIHSTPTFAAYPDDSCTFQYPGDNKTINVKCTDDPANGTLDGAVYKLTGPQSYSFTQTYEIDEPLGGTRILSCTSSIKISSSGISSGTISGQYVLPKTISSPKCIDLDRTTIKIDTGLYDTVQLSNKMYKALTKPGGKLATEIRQHCKEQAGGSTSGSQYTSCLLKANSELQKCHNSVLPQAFIAASGTGDFATVYKTKMRDCIKGSLSYLTNKSINESLNDAVAAQTKFKNTPVVDVEEEEGNTTSCAIDGIGWLICPVARIVSTFNDSLFGILNNLLEVNSSMFTTSGGNDATYKTWTAVRNIANAAFVLAFLVLIYSQITGAGITNYGIKKMLPKLVIAAILVNVSFWICAIAVDLSNIIGSSINDLFKDFAGRVDDTTNGLSGWDNLTGWLLAGGAGTLAVGGAVVTIGSYGFLGALALLIPLAVTALVAVLTVVFILTARQAFIIILVVIAPLAFVAYLLPNTEGWFDKWRKFFFSMLLIYPLVGALFGGSQLAAAIIRASSDDALTYILSLVVQVVPLFMVPILLKFSGGLIGRVAGMINNPNKGPFDRMKKSGTGIAERRKGFRMGERMERTEEFRSGTRGSTALYGTQGSRRRRARAWVAGIGNTNAADKAEKDKYSKVASDAAARSYVAERASTNADYATSLAGGDPKLAGHVQAYAQQAVDEELEKDAKAAQVRLKQEQLSTSLSPAQWRDELARRATDTSLAKHENMAAIRQFGEIANAQSVNDLTEEIADLGSSGVDKETRATIQRTFSQTFRGDSRLPNTVSGTNHGEMASGDFTKKRTQRIASDIKGVGTEGGKVNAEYIAKMDVDEMRDWVKEFKDPTKVAQMGLSADQKKSVVAAIQAAYDDEILGKKIGTGSREESNLNEITTLLGGTMTLRPR